MPLIRHKWGGSLETAHRPVTAVIRNRLTGKHLHNSTCDDLVDGHLFVPRVLLMRFITVWDKEGRARTLHMHLFTSIYDAPRVTGKIKICSWPGFKWSIISWCGRMKNDSETKVSVQGKNTEQAEHAPDPWSSWVRDSAPRAHHNRSHRITGPPVPAAAFAAWLCLSSLRDSPQSSWGVTNFLIYHSRLIFHLTEPSKRWKRSAFMARNSNFGVN